MTGSNPGAPTVSEALARWVAGLEFDRLPQGAVRMARHLRESGACYALGLGVESDHIPLTLHDQADLLVSGVQGVEAFMAWLLSAVSASSI